MESQTQTGPSSSRPPNPDEITRQAQLDRLKTFLATAPSRWSSSQSSVHGQNHQHQHYQQQQQQQQQQSAAAAQQYSLSSSSQLPTLPTSHPALNRFLLPSGEYISCVLWAGLYHITGTDIVRALVFRFEAFGRPVINMKKFEEGVFSDLRNLKPGTDACLEEPKSPFLDLLFKYQCIRTQKKQKVFYWFSVPHDRLFLDALERDLKREKMGQESTTVPRGEPGLSFTYDPKRTLYEQFLKPNTNNGVAGGGGGGNGPLSIGRASGGRGGGGGGNANGEDDDDDDDDNDNEDKDNDDELLLPSPGNHRGMNTKNLSVVSPADIMSRRIKKSNNMNSVKVEEADSSSSATTSQQQQRQQNSEGNASSSSSGIPPNKETFLKMFSLFEGSPTYKQRRKKPSGSGFKGQANAATAAAENSRRRSIIATEVVSRRGSVLANNDSGRRGSMIAAAAALNGAESPMALSSLGGGGGGGCGSVHPSLGNNKYQSNSTAAGAAGSSAFQSSGSSSRPSSQHQQLSNYGLSTNRGAQDLERDEYMSMSRQQQQQPLHHSPQQMSISELEAERGDGSGRPSTATTSSSTQTTTFICQLPSCQRPFPRKDLLQKHMPSHAAGAILQSRWRERREASGVRDGAGDDGATAGGLRFPCEGCLKIFYRAENLRLHMASCIGRSSRGNTANSGGTDEHHQEMEMNGLDMEMEVGVVPMDASYDDDVAGYGGNPTLNLDLAYPHRDDIGSSHGGGHHHPADAIHGHGHPPNSAGSTTAQGHYASAETSPYVETPEGGGLAQWVNVSPVHPRTMHHIPEHQDQHSAAHQQQQQQQHQEQQQQAHQYHPLAGIPVLSHHLSWQNLGSGTGSGMTSPPGSANSAHSVFGAQQLQQTLHPRYRSPESAGYGYAHPSSAPSQKVAFDQSSLYPPNYQHAPRAGAGGAMTGVSLRRYRSATPRMTGNGGGGLRAEYHPAHQQHHVDSRPASSAGGESNYDYGSVVVNPAAAAAAAAAAAHGHPFAYSVDSGDGRLSYVPPGSAHGVGVVPNGAGGPGSDHSSPQSYGNVAMVNGEYIESNSQYDGSNGSPGSVGHGGATMIPMSEPRIMVPMPPPPRGHIHSLSSEIATQQMQQYVDLDGLAEDNDVPPPVSASAPPSFHGHVRYPQQQQPQQQQQSRYHDESHDGVPRYLHAEQQAVVGAAYHSSSSEGGHEEMYPYRFQQQQAAMHTHQPEHSQPPYPSRYYHEQRVAL